MLLRGIRDEMTAKLVERHEAKLEAKHAVDPTSDEFAEDLEDEHPLRDTDTTGVSATEDPATPTAERRHPRGPTTVE